MGLIGTTISLPFLIIKLILTALYHLIKIILALCIFIIDHVLGLIAGIFVGLGKGLSGMFGIGLRSFAFNLLAKK